MTGLHRLAATVVCWGLTLLAIFTAAGPYIPTIPPSIDLWLRVIWVVGMAIIILAVVFVVLLAWTWVWFRRLS